MDVKNPLLLRRDAHARLVAHACEAYPHEAVGVLAGDAGGRRVLRAVPLVNEHADSPRNRYVVSGLVLYRAEQALADEGLDVLGYYHSHPDHPARYSETDREHALPNLSYLIVAVGGASGAPKVEDTRVWRLREDRSAMDEEPIHFEEDPSA